MLFNSLKLIALAIIGSVLTGCATPIPLDNISYSGTNKASTSTEAKIRIISGAIKGDGTTTLVPVGGIFVPLSSGPNPELQFNEKDQQQFGQSLEKELAKRGILKRTEAGNEKTPQVNILFAQTRHMPSFQEYVLDVVMEMKGGKEPFLKQYRILSSENDSIGEKWSTNSYQGKEKAAKLLLAKLIPDIDDYFYSIESNTQK